MWPFSQKQKVDAKRELFNQTVMEYPIGYVFDYLGIKMRVCDNEFEKVDLSIGSYDLIHLFCDYVDKNGILHTHKFNHAEFQGLLDLKKGIKV